MPKNLGTCVESILCDNFCNIYVIYIHFENPKKNHKGGEGSKTMRLSEKTNKNC